MAWATNQKAFAPQERALLDIRNHLSFMDGLASTSRSDQFEGFEKAIECAL